MRKFIFLISILLLPVMTFAQSGWYVQNSSTANTLNDIFFINQNTGWAVGDNGTIVKTTNGGFSWISLNSSINIHLNKVQFVNQQTGWAVGGMHQTGSPCWNYTVILKTTDGGLNWVSQIPTGLGYVYKDLSVIDGNTALTTGEALDFSQCIMGTGIVQKTVDGGINWSGLSTQAGIGFVYKSISFVNSTTGYVTAMYNSDVLSTWRKLLKTTNGGINWSTRTTDSSAQFSNENNYLRFFDENTGYYINGNFLKTTNGGINWTKFDSLSVYGMNKFSFPNLNTGYLVGQNKLVKTFNGGANFTTHPGATYTGLNSVCAVDTNHVWACGAGGKIVYGGNAIVADTASIKYFPLKIGNSWTYYWQDDFFQFGYNKFTITGDTVVNGYRYYKMFSNDAGGTGLIALDSLTGNLYRYSTFANCNGTGGRLLRDSLAARLNNTYLSCLTANNRCIDTSNISVFGVPTKSKQFEIDWLINEKETYAKGFGLIRTINCEGTCTVSDLQGCVIDGVVYGDTSLHASPYKAYLPLKVGNSWTYKRTIFDPPAPIQITYETITITGDTLIQGIRYYKTSGQFPFYNGNIVTIDSLTGNILRYMESSSCSQYPKRFLLDSLGAKIGNTIQSCPNTNTNGLGLDTNHVFIFGGIIKTKNFSSPYTSPIGLSRRYGEKFGLIQAGAMEGASVSYQLTNCNIDGVYYSDSLKSISGTVKFADNNQSASDGYVKAIKINTSNGNIITLDSTQIGINGNYSLTHLPNDSCDIVAYPNSEKQSDFIPTYYPSTINWLNAVKVYAGNNPANINVAVIRKNETQGMYSISGMITPYTTNAAGLSGAIVYIKQGSYFREYSITNSTGNFNAHNLLPGEYQVIVDRLGYIGGQQNATIVSGNLTGINFSLIPAYSGIHSTSDIIPENFSLYQNYPNPFNPVTNIKFDIPKSSFVSMKIYNIVGKEVAVLLNENKSAGSYVLDFDASALSSGVYFYRIETEGFTETKRMVILK